MTKKGVVLRSSQPVSGRTTIPTPNVELNNSTSCHVVSLEPGCTETAHLEVIK